SGKGSHPFAPRRWRQDGAAPVVLDSPSFVYYNHNTRRRYAMRNWTMAFLPLALAMTATGCSGADRGDRGDRSETRGDADRAADAGPQTTQNFTLAGFTGVQVAGPDDVTIRQGDNFSIAARGPQAEIDELDITLDGALLSIGRKREGFSLGGGRHRGVEIA